MRQTFQRKFDFTGRFRKWKKTETQYEVLEISFWKSISPQKIEKNAEFVTQFNDQQRIVLSTRKAHGKHVYNLSVQYLGESYSKKTKTKKKTTEYGNSNIYKRNRNSVKLTGKK